MPCGRLQRTVSNEQPITNNEQPTTNYEQPDRSAHDVPLSGTNRVIPAGYYPPGLAESAFPSASKKIVDGGVDVGRVQSLFLRDRET
jgi:hypothetical protein